MQRLWGLVVFVGSALSQVPSTPIVTAKFETQIPGLFTLKVDVSEPAVLNVVSFAGLSLNNQNLAQLAQRNLVVTPSLGPSTSFSLLLTVTSDPDLQEGPIHFDLQLTTLAGNVTEIRSVTEGDVKSIDRVRPTGTITCINSTNTNRRLATVGDTVRLDVRASEFITVFGLRCGGVKLFEQFTGIEFAIDVPISPNHPDGLLVCTIESFSDPANNKNGENMIIPCNVTVDKTPPIVTLATISSNANLPSRARPGSDVTVQIQANEPFTVKSATIAGVAASRNTVVSQTDANVSGLVPASVLDNQPVGFTIQISDLAGNARTVTTTTDSSAVTVDLTPPTAQICYSSTTTPGFAKNESRVHVVFTPSESVEATFQCLGVSRTFRQATSFSFDHTVVVPRPITQPFSCTVDYQDGAGNPSNTFTIPANCNIVIDTIVPQTRRVSMASNNVLRQSARVGDKVTVTIEVNEDVRGVTVDPSPSFLWTTKSQGTTATLEVTVGESFTLDQPVRFTAHVFDKADNEVVVTEARSVDSVNIVVQRPSVVVEFQSTTLLPSTRVEMTISTTTTITDVHVIFNGRFAPPVIDAIDQSTNFSRVFGIDTLANEPIVTTVTLTYVEFSTQLRQNETFIPGVVSICPVGFVKNTITFACEKVDCPSNSDGHPFCECSTDFGGSVEWTGTLFVGSCTPCANGEVSVITDKCVQTSNKITSQCTVVPCPALVGVVNNTRANCPCDLAQGFTGIYDLDISRSTWVGSCSKCSECSFLQYELDPCNTTTDANCTSTPTTLAPLIVAVLLWLVSVALILQVRLASMTKRELFILLATSLLGFLNVCCDVGFILFDATDVLLVIAVTFVVFPGLINAATFLFLFVKCIKATDRHSIFRQTLRIEMVVKHHSTVYAIATPLAVLNPRLTMFFLRPVPKSRLQTRIVWAELLPVLIENAPQAAIQTYFVIMNPLTLYSICAVTLSYLSMAHQLISICSRFEAVSVVGQARRRGSFVEPIPTTTKPPTQPGQRETVAEVIAESLESTVEAELAATRERIASLEKELAKERDTANQLRANY